MVATEPSGKDLMGAIAIISLHRRRFREVSDKRKSDRQHSVGRSLSLQN